MGAQTQLEAVREAYERLAVDYETEFTGGLIAGLQRRSIRRRLAGLFRPGRRVLDLGCGTGEDSLWFAGRGVTVHGVDVSPAMLEIARYKASSSGLESFLTFEERSIEALDTLEAPAFDGALSNFGAFNCVRELEPAAEQLGRLVRPGGWTAICLLNRHSLWATALGALAALLRRKGEPSHETESFELYYPSVRQMAEAFEPWFALESTTGIGVALPPADLESFARRYPEVIQALARFDRTAGRLPVLRTWADQRLLIFRRRMTD